MGKTIYEKDLKTRNNIYEKIGQNNIRKGFKDPKQYMKRT